MTPQIDKPPPPPLPENIFQRDAPAWMPRIVFFLRIGLALFIGLSLLLSGCSAQASKGVNWQPATSVFSSEEVALILAKHSAFNINNLPPEWVNQAQVLEVEALRIIDFNNPGLCGEAGCLYVGYAPNPSGEMVQVLYVRLDKNLPPSIPLFEDAHQEAENLPCINIHQVQGKDIEQTRLCFNGKAYVVQSKVLLG